mmetsp:Transcript_20899/g.37495  ORF Transcript_20899/g.37495 Transcript_20899/m.37495 type:complete len:98 (+) Transcript_20899:793-1086(+)
MVHDLSDLFDNNNKDDDQNDKESRSDLQNFIPDVSHFHQKEEEDCVETDGNNGCVMVCTTTKRIFEGDVLLDETVKEKKRACGGGLTEKQMRKQGSD